MKGELQHILDEDRLCNKLITFSKVKLKHFSSFSSNFNSITHILYLSNIKYTHIWMV